MRSPPLVILIALVTTACPDTRPTPDDDDTTAGDDDDDTATDDDTAEDDDTAADDDAAPDDDDTISDDDTSSTDPIPEDPAESGPLSFDVADAEGRTFYIPEGEGPFPVIVFVHGFQLGPADYASYGELLASWGYAVVMPELGGTLFDPRTHAEHRDDLVALLDWLDSQPAVLGGATSANLMLAGHSLGGKLSLLVASEDPRPLGVFAIDPVDAGPPFGGNETDYPSVAPERMDDIAVPIMLVGEWTNATSTFGQACAPEGENFAAYFDAASSPAMEVDFLQASHMSFLDNPNCAACLLCPAGSDDPAETRLWTQRLLHAFAAGTFANAGWAGPWLGGAELDPAESSGILDFELRNGF